MPRSGWSTGKTGTGKRRSMDDWSITPWAAIWLRLVAVFDRFAGPPGRRRWDRWELHIRYKESLDLDDGVMHEIGPVMYPFKRLAEWKAERARRQGWAITETSICRVGGKPFWLWLR